ncbi:beta-galactosidase trimerization domain-containing protein [Paenibacillus sp. HJGM_3]|uniref:beta-galactosidase trimerization domain-containing protein n=1 Tax=Paenibacillus sp. HJGM_3 TaxID=3379816 RepID=UPI00385F6168
MGGDLYKRTFRRGLFDFHAGEAIPEVTLDVESYIAGAAAAGMQTITFMTKDAFGNSYYDTRIGHKNAKLKGDLLAEASAAAKRHGINLVAYYNVGLNTHVALQNPDYRQRTAEQEPVTEAFGFYDLLCMNSPYRDYVYGQLEEIATHYEVSGFFFDISYVWTNCCYCEYCQTRYKARYGYAMPTSPQPGTTAMSQWQAFRRDIRQHFMRDAAMRLKAINPELLIGWNHAGDPRFGQVETDRYADYFTSEFHPPHYAYGSLLARWKRSFAKPFELMMPSEMGSWGEWTLAPTPTLMTTAAIAVANGGSISFGHVAYPSGEYKGRIPAPVMSAISAANHWVKTLEPWLLEAESEPMVAVLYALENKRMLEDAALARSKNEEHLQGVHRILTEGHIHFDIIDETHLLERLERYELLIVPDQAYLSDTVQRRIREYVQNGGCLVASGRTSLYKSDGERDADFGLADLFGVQFLDESTYSLTYLDSIDARLAENVPDMPILLKQADQRSLRVVPTSSEVLCSLTEPALETTVNRHVYHQHAHPARRTPDPAITFHTPGKGKCMYIAGPIEAAYWSSGSPWLRNIYLNGIRKLYPNPKVEVKAPLSVEVNVMRQREPSRLIVHLINVREDKAAGSKSFIEDVAAITNIRVSLGVQATRVLLQPEGVELDFTCEQDRISFLVPRLEIHTAVVVEGVD